MSYILLYVSHSLYRTVYVLYRSAQALLPTLNTFLCLVPLVFPTAIAHYDATL
jgi:hypothetical protein